DRSRDGHGARPWRSLPPEDSAVAVALGDLCGVEREGPCLQQWCLALGEGDLERRAVLVDLPREPAHVATAPVAAVGGREAPAQRHVEVTAASRIGRSRIAADDLGDRGGPAAVEPDPGSALWTGVRGDAA